MGWQDFGLYNKVCKWTHLHIRIITIPVNPTHFMDQTCICSVTWWSFCKNVMIGMFSSPSYCKSHLQYIQRKQSTVDSLVSKGSPLLSTAAKRNVFKGNIFILRERDYVTPSIAWNSWGPSHSPIGHLYWRLTSGEPFPPSPLVWGEVDREDSVPKKGKALWDYLVFPVLVKHTCVDKHTCVLIKTASLKSST